MTVTDLDRVKALIKRMDELHGSSAYQALCRDEAFLRALSVVAVEYFNDRTDAELKLIAKAMPMIALLVMAALED